MRRLRYALAAITILTIPASAQWIQHVGEPARGAYTHQDSGMSFPASVGAFQRFRLQIGPTPRDISSGYAYITASARISVSVFVEHDDDPGSCRKMADLEKSRMKPGASLSDIAAPPMPNGLTGIAMLAKGALPNPAMNVQDTYYYCALGWRVEYLFQRADTPDAVLLESGFLSAMPVVLVQKN